MYPSQKLQPTVGSCVTGLCGSVMVLDDDAGEKSVVPVPIPAVREWRTLSQVLMRATFVGF